LKIIEMRAQVVGARVSYQLVGKARFVGGSKQQIAGTSDMDERSRNMLSRSAMGVTRRWATVLLTITAWIFLSNHCALALSGTVVDSATGGCPMHSAPAKEKPAANLPCCKELRAVGTQMVKSVAAVAKELVGSRDYVAENFPPPPRLTIEAFALDTGPPGAFSFAELVLQRSFLAHAPPVVFARV
jgi:hypothetical protein